MKLMSKIFVILALLIFSAVMAGGNVSADNYVDLDNHLIEWDEYLVLEVDFTQGSSAVIAIEISSTEPMDVWFIPDYSLVSLITDGKWYYYSGLSSSGSQVYNEFLNLDIGPDDWPHRTYYFVIMTYDLKVIRVDVECQVWIDYDGDGLCGPNDEIPLIDNDWLEALEDRLAGMESNLTLNHQWVTENITALSLTLDDLGNSISDEFLILRDDLDLKISGLLGELEILRVDIRDGLENNVAGLLEKTAILQSLLSTLEIQISEVCNTMDETMVSMESEIAALSEALNTTDEWLQDVENYMMVRMASLDANLSMLHYATGELDYVLVELDGREKENNDARTLEIQNAQTDIEKAQEDIKKALDEAEAARTVGMVTGVVGILLAVAAIVMVGRIKREAGI